MKLEPVIKKTVVTNFRLPPDTRARLEALAEENDLSYSDVVCQLIDQYYEMTRKAPKPK